jgi:hypothetical protein
MIKIPPKWIFSKNLEANVIRQLLYPPVELDGDVNLLEPGEELVLGGKRILVSKTPREHVPDGVDDVPSRTAN